MVIGPVEQKTNIRFRSMDAFENYLNAIDIDYDSKDVTFTGYVYILNTPELKVVKERAYAKGTNYMKKMVKYRGQNCYIPTSGSCFINCNTYFTIKDYTQEVQDFITNEKYQSGLMTSARIEPFCKNYDLNIGCFDGTRINPRNVTQRHFWLFIYNSHFCVLWKSSGIGFNQGI